MTPHPQPFQKTFVVLPTYNERENVAKMVAAIFALPLSNLYLLIVDDSSPDGTAEEVTQLQDKFPGLHLLIRSRKEGLGRAYVDGFQKALESGADSVIQMDADFSHDPNDIPRLLEALKKSDLVIGSRYVADGKTQNWNPFRLFLSRFANFYACFITGMPVKDGTAGFKAWKGTVLREIGLESIRTNGYGFQLETTHRAFKKGFNIEEIPIVFRERREGSSKMNRKIVWEAFWLVWKLKFKQG